MDQEDDLEKGYDIGIKTVAFQAEKAAISLELLLTYAWHIITESKDFLRIKERKTVNKIITTQHRESLHRNVYFQH